eukprot:3625551-Pyramimonas_sp.AAC.1
MRPRDARREAGSARPGGQDRRTGVCPRPSPSYREPPHGPIERLRQSPEPRQGPTSRPGNSVPPGRPKHGGPE